MIKTTESKHAEQAVKRYAESVESKSTKAEKFQELAALLNELFQIKDKLNQKGGNGDGK